MIFVFIWEIVVNVLLKYAAQQGPTLINNRGKVPKVCLRFKFNDLFPFSYLSILIQLNVSCHYIYSFSI